MFDDEIAYIGSGNSVSGEVQAKQRFVKIYDKLYFIKEKEIFVMKRIKAACLLQTICFQSKDGCPSEFNRQQIKKEYEAYIALLNRRGTQFKILEESEQSDGSLIIKLKKQNSRQPVGDYLG